MSPRPVLWILAACCMLVAALPSAAGAATSPTWLTGSTVNGEDTQSLGSMPLVDTEGNPWVFWLGIDPDTSNPALLTRTRSAAGWNTPEVVSTGGAAMAQFAVAALPDGQLAAAWMQDVGGNHTVVVATRDGDGNWSAPHHVSDSTRFSSELVLVADTAGNLTAAWRDSSLIVAARRPAGGSWDAPETISDTTPGGHLVASSAVAAPNGDVTVLWESGSTAIGSATYSGGAWQTPQELARPNNPDVVRLMSDANGNLFAAWHEGDFGQGHSDVAVMRRAAGASSWEAPEILNQGGLALVPDIAGLPNGDVVVIWTALNQTYSYVARTRVWSSTEHAWSDEMQLFDDGWGAVDFVPLADGDLLASISHIVAGQQVVAIMRRDGDTGVWSTPNELAGTNSMQQSFTYLAADPAGNAVVAWDEQPGNSSTHRAHAAVADGAGPLLRNVTAPTSGVVGQQLSFSVSPFDLWSPLGTTTWDFDDGSTSTSAAATHTFNAPGEFAVTVEASDLTGQVSSTTRVVTITPRPAVVDPPAEDETPPVVTPKPPAVLAPVVEARLAGRKITLRVKMTLRAGRACSGKAYATTTFGTRTYRSTLTLGKVSGACVAKGTITLKKTPSARTKLKVSVRGSNARTRTLTTRRD